MFNQLIIILDRRLFTHFEKQLAESIGDSKVIGYIEYQVLKLTYLRTIWVYII